MATARRIRIFISSPSDVRPERLTAEQVVRRLDREFSYHFRVEALLWEREPLLATHHFQDIENLPAPRTADICVVVLWTRLGVNLPQERFRGAISGEAPVTGTEWEFEDALAGWRSVRRPDLLVYRKQGPAPRVELDRTTVATALEQQDRLSRFVRRWLQNEASGEFLVASHDFNDTAEFETRLEEHLRSLLRRRLESELGSDAEIATISWTRAPWRGLEAFGPDDSPVFFGRTRARNEVRDLLTDAEASGRAFVLVMGASGSGKSSLIKSGLLADLKLPGMIGRVALVRHAIMRPTDAEADPARALAHAILEPEALPELSGLRYTEERLANMLRDDPAQLAFAVEQGMAEAGTGQLSELGEARLLVIVDQLEELFTAERITQAEREAFIRALEALATSGLAWVVASMRSDFFDRLATLPELEALSRSSRYLLVPPSVAELGQIVREPARATGLRFETDPATHEGLDDEIVKAASADPAALPLLSFALDQLWQARDRETGRLTLAAYRALGGFEGALGRRAEQLFQGLSAAEQAAFPEVLQALITVGQGALARATARTARRSRFPAETPAGRLVATLLSPSARLLVADGDGEGGLVRLAHEALLTHWDRARQAIQDNWEDLQRRTRVEQAAALWTAAANVEKGERLLPPGLALSEGDAVLARFGDGLDPATVAFVQASRLAATAARRRQRHVVAAAFVLLVFLTIGACIGAWLGYKGQREAEAQRHLADEALAAATSTANSLVNDLAVKFRDVEGMPRSLIRDIIGSARALQDQLLRSGESTPGLRHSRTEALTESASTLLDVGDTSGALATAAEAVDLAKGLVAEDPGNAQWQHDLAVSHRRMGAAKQALGDLPGALASYRESLGLIRSLANSTPENVQWQQELINSYENVGIIQDAQGDRAGALNSFRDTIALASRLAASAPGRIDWQRDLASADLRVGDILEQQDSFAESMKYYEDELSIMKRLAAADPTNTDYQNQISTAIERIGQVLEDEGRLSEALPLRYEDVEISERLARSDPSNSLWQRSLGIAYYTLGGTQEGMGKLSEAMQSFRNFLAVMDRLTRSDSGNAIWQQDLARAHGMIGTVRLEQGDANAALDSRRAQVSILQHLVESTSENQGARSRLAEAKLGIGDVHLARGAPADALKAYRESASLLEDLARTDPTNADWQVWYAQAQAGIGTAEAAESHFSEALVAARKAVGLAEALDRAVPDHADREEELAETLVALGDVLNRSGDHDLARDAWQRAQMLLVKSVAAAPETAQWQAELQRVSRQLDSVHPQAQPTRPAKK